MSALATLGEYLSYSFVQYALVVGVLIAVCSSLLGPVLVMRRMSFIGDGLSHVAFGAYAVAAVASITQDMLVVLPVTLAAAVLLLRREQSGNRAVKGDAALAMMSVAALAFGYLVMNVFGTSANVSGDVCGILFGSTSILSLTPEEVVACVVLSAMVGVAYWALYPRLFAAAFDEPFARATGLATGRVNLAVAVLVAVVIVLGMNLVGALLLSALIVFPTLAAMRTCHTFAGVTVFAAVFSVVCAVAGMVVSILAGTPVGSTIVMLDALGFGIFWFIGRVKG